MDVRTISVSIVQYDKILRIARSRFGHVHGRDGDKLNKYALPQGLTRLSGSQGSGDYAVSVDWCGLEWPVFEC